MVFSFFMLLSPLTFGSASSSFLSLSSTSLCGPLTASQDPPDNNLQVKDSVNWNAAVCDCISPHNLQSLSSLDNNPLKAALSNRSLGKFLVDFTRF